MMKSIRSTILLDQCSVHLKLGVLKLKLVYIATLSIVLFTSKLYSQDVNPLPVNLKFTALDGRYIDIASLKGKVVLIDCWATWCSPCLKEMPHIRELYAKYRDQGFEVIGISLDDSSSRERVAQIIQENNIPWPQRFEGKGPYEDSFAKMYQITSLPTVFLLDKDGNIIDNNARGKRLEILLKKYLGI